MSLAPELGDPEDVEAVKVPAGGNEPWFESAADLLAEPDPGPTPFLVESLIVEGAVAALVGPPKARKTWTLLELAIAVATGGKAFGRFAVARPGPVLVVVEESGRTALHRRLDMLARGRALEPEALSAFYFAANRRVRLDQDEWRSRLLEAAGEKPWRLIAFDPLVRVKGHVNENDQSEMGPVLDFLRELRDASGGAVAYNHHTPHAGSRQRGSSDLEAFWESKLTLFVDGEKRTLEAEHREAEAAEPHDLSFRFHAETQTLRIDADEDELGRQVREYLEEHPDASANEADQAIEGNRQRILELVKRHREGGSESPEPPGTTPPAETGSGGRGYSPLKGGCTPPAEPVGGTGSSSLEPLFENDSGDEDEDDPDQAKLDHYREVRDRPPIDDLVGGGTA